MIAAKQTDDSKGMLASIGVRALFEICEYRLYFLIDLWLKKPASGWFFVEITNKNA